jgi:hypothetical protein
MKIFDSPSSRPFSTPSVAPPPPTVAPPPPTVAQPGSGAASLADLLSTRDLFQPASSSSQKPASLDESLARLFETRQRRASGLAQPLTLGLEVGPGELPDLEMPAPRPPAPAPEPAPEPEPSGPDRVETGHFQESPIPARIELGFPDE